MTPVSFVSRKAAAGFSLVEVVLALGIVAVVLIPLIGLLVVAQQQNRESREKTEIALILQTVESALRAESQLGTVGIANRFNQLRTVVSTGSGTNWYFGVGGRRITGADPQNNALTQYRARFFSTNHDANRIVGVVTISYPRAAGFPNTNSFPLAIYRYGTRL